MTEQEWGDLRREIGSLDDALMEIHRLRGVLDIHANMMHPWYGGGCDALGPNGQCSVCLEVLGRADKGLTALSRRAAILAELHALQARQKELRAELGSPAQRREAIITSIREGETRQDVAVAFGLTYQSVTMIAARYERDQAIIAAYHETGSLQKAGDRFGITRERVRQLLVRDEQDRGITKVRYRKMPRGDQNSRYIPRVEWRCQGCGAKRMVLPRQANGATKCRKCSKRRHLTDELIARAIAIPNERGAWTRLALAAGYQPNATWQLHRAVFSKLVSENQDDKIAELWGDGVPHWLQKYDHRVEKGS